MTLGCPPHLSVPISEKSAGKKHLPTHPDPRLLSAAGFSVPRAHESSFQRVDGGALVTARALSHFPSSPFPGSHFPGAQLPGQSHRHSLCAHACACDFGGIDGLGCLASMPVSEQGLWDSGHGCSLGLCVSEPWVSSPRVWEAVGLHTPCWSRVVLARVCVCGHRGAQVCQLRVPVY